MRVGGHLFESVWLVDFEFHQPPGDRPTPLCMVAHNFCTGMKLRMRQDKLQARQAAPFPTGAGSLFVAYYASAEINCFLSLGWPVPLNIIDLYAEFRCLTNGLRLPCGRGLLGALTFFGLDPHDAREKEEMRNLAIRGGPYTPQERQALLDYCADDVRALARLLPAMEPHLDLPRALLRGRYMAAAAQMEFCGVPIDMEAFGQLQEHWVGIQEELIRQVDGGFGVYEGQTFKEAKFTNWLKANGLPWPRLESGRLDLADDTFRQMARVHPQVRQLRELRYTLSQLRLSNLSIGQDGRNRVLLSAFSAKTSRNQPSNSRFIFGPSTWLRGLIKPGKGKAVAYIDWSQQEFGIAAALSGDPTMMQAYRSGDPYLAFAKQAGAAPQEATKQSHPEVRERFKACALGVQYGMGETSLAIRINQSPAHAAEIIRLHRATYPRYWQWSQAAVSYAMLHGQIHTTFGWRLRVEGMVNVRSVANFPIQANGAEMLRLACIFATERGLSVCAPVHDAILIEASQEQLQQHVAIAQGVMAEASRLVLSGFELNSDVKSVVYPERYMDGRGKQMWDTVWEIIVRLRDDIHEVG